MKTIEVDPRVPGIRDEIPFPQARQCSPDLDFPQLSIQVSVQSEIQCLQEKLIVTKPTKWTVEKKLKYKGSKAKGNQEVYVKFQDFPGQFNR